MTLPEACAEIARLTKELSAERVHSENLKRVAIAAVQAGVYQVRELQQRLEKVQGRAATRGAEHERAMTAGRGE